MTRSFGTTLLVIVFLASLALPASSGTPPAPLDQTRLMALVAGSVLPETVVREISTQGLSFHPTDAYLELLKKAGATDAELMALASAPVRPTDPRSETANMEALQHLSSAAAAAQHGSFDEAAADLRAALHSTISDPETGFVMGDVLRRQERWSDADLMYQAVLQRAPDFADAHTKRSFALVRLQDADNALIEAKAALAANPDDAEAHKNAGMAYGQMRKFDAAIAEYQTAVRLKPDYEAAIFDLGISLDQNGDLDAAIVQYRKTIVLNPRDRDAHYNLALALGTKGQSDAAILEYHQAISINPAAFDAHANLAALLSNTHRYPEAVAEYREMLRLFPDSAVCHQCLAKGLYFTGDPDGALAEYRKAGQLDPTAPGPHNGLGYLYYGKKQYDRALAEFRAARALDPSSLDSYRGAASVLIDQKNYAEACDDLKIAATSAPSDPAIHDLFGRALDGLGKHAEAAAEFQQAIALSPGDPQIKLRLAYSFEATGDWPRALDLYRQAANQNASVDGRSLGNVGVIGDRDPSQEYSAAQERYAAHLAALRSAGKAADADALQARVKTLSTSVSLSEKVDAAMRSGWNEAHEGHMAQARVYFQQAVDAEGEMHPPDNRVLLALDSVGNSSVSSDPAAAQAAFERELQVAGELQGPTSAGVVQALTSLGHIAMYRKDFATAEKVLFRAVDINTQLFGEGSDKVAESLRVAAQVFVKQQQYAKAEPYLLRAVHIDEVFWGKDGAGLLMPLYNLCALYQAEQDFGRDMPCEQQLEGVVAKRFGDNSPAIVSVLQFESKDLRALSKPGEADQVDQRIASIRSATMKSTP